MKASITARIAVYACTTGVQTAIPERTHSAGSVKVAANRQRSKRCLRPYKLGLQ
jgi:hypothetical protein